MHDNSEISALVSLHALIGRMRILSSDAVIERAEVVAARMIVDTYFAPNKTFPELRQLMASHSTDPLKEFSLTCRKELSGPSSTASPSAIPQVVDLADLCTA